MQSPARAPFLTRQRLLILVGLFAGAFLALFYVWESWQSVYWLNQLHKSDQELSALENQRENLRFDVAQAFSLIKIEEAARRLGMIRPSPDNKTLNYIDLSK
jgi:cell division protein FtsL